MSGGLSKKLVGQIAEHLVVAELRRRGLIATGFSGNVPTFDLIAAEDQCRTVPIQVKASSGDSWPSDARDFMLIDYEQAQRRQVFGGPVVLTTPDLIYVFVAVAKPDSQARDRFFILTMRDLQTVCIRCYQTWMDPKQWQRPKNPESYDNRFWIRDI